MGLFGRLFGNRAPELPPADLSLVGVDMHSHFIPGIDDGSPDLDTTMELLQAMADLGYRKVITTPHSMADGYRNPTDKILAGLEQVRAEAARRGIAIEVEASAEYYLDHELEEKVKRKDILTFGDRLLLFELSFIGEPHVLNSVVFEMQTQGYRPVLAHPERYTFWAGQLDKYEALKDRSVLFQVNIPSLSGRYGPGVQKTAE
ncbi:MAG TPA: hypothetical protein P5027_02505, partial [Flavobacteriales bacterium]|nr:hypothetical protein [Flavobacteriales bacterium]